MEATIYRVEMRDDSEGTSRHPALQGSTTLRKTLLQALGTLYRAVDMEANTTGRNRHRVPSYLLVPGYLHMCTCGWLLEVLGGTKVQGSSAIGLRAGWWQA